MRSRWIGKRKRENFCSLFLEGGGKGGAGDEVGGGKTLGIEFNDAGKIFFERRSQS